MSKRRKLIINIILISILILLALVSTLLYINLYPRVSVHLISDNELLDTIQIKKNSSIPALKSPEKEGYTFEGWYNDQDYTSPFVYGESLSDDIELYAKFTAIDYTLTFNYGEISNIYPSAIYHFYDAVALPDGTETILIQGEETTLATLKQGYEFAGWAPTKNSTVATYGKGTTFLMPSSNVNLYAVWEPIAYSVRYYIQDLNQVDAVRDVDADGFVAYNANSHVKYGEIEYKYNTKVVAPDAPKNEQGYYQFVGWYEDPQFTKPINFNQTYMGLNQLSNINLVPIYDTDNEDQICLYGKWQVVRFNIAFCLNGSSRVGTKYVVKDSSVMQTDENGSYTNSDFFKYKEDVYFGLPLSYLDGGIYSNALLDGQVYYSYGTLRDTVSHKFVGWFTTRNASEGTQYKNDTQFNPEDFPEYYTNRDEGFSFLEPGIRTYVLYAAWEEFLHIEYSYNGSILDRQQVENGKTGQLNDPAKMPNVKKSGYHFIGWSKTADALNTGATIYKLGQNYKFTTEASESENENCLFFSVGNRKTTLYPIFKPNNYEIKYDFSINTLGSDGKLNVIKDTQPNNVVFSDYMKEKLAETYIIRYNTTVNGRLESHTVLNSIDTNGNSNATYKDTSGETYLLLSWAVVDEDNNVVATYAGNNEIYANSTNSVIYKYSKEKSTGNYEFVIKAIWTTQMTITFDKGWDDVEGEVPASITGMTGATIKLPTTPSLTRPYHVFRGWVVDAERIDENGKENYNPANVYLSNNSYSFSENTTLYALWEPIEYKLVIRNTTVNGNEGAQIASISIGAGVYKNIVAQVTLGENIVIGDGATATVIPLSSPQAGYSLTGFSIVAGGDVVFANGEVITILSEANKENIFNPYPASNAKTFVIYAKYEIKSYDIEIDSDGDGTYETKEEDVRHGSLLRDNMPNPSLAEGYEIAYWEVDNGVEIVKIENMNASDFKVTSDLKVKLYTKIQTFTVLIQQTDPVSGNIVSEIKKEGVEYNSTLQLDPTDDDYITYFGYIFDGWYLGETKVELATQVITSNATYKTKYVADKVRFVYHANKDADDTTTMNSSVFDYGTEFTLPTQVLLGSGFTKSGYVLSGWTLDADNTEFVGATNTIVKVSNDKFDESLFVTELGQTGYVIHIYAQYSRQFTVSFEFPDTVTASGNTSIVEKYIAGSEINVASFIKNNSISITPDAGYVFNNDWYVKGFEDVLYSEYEVNVIVVNDNIVLMPFVETIKYTAVFNYKYPSQSTYTTLEDYTQENIEIDNEDTKINLPSAEMLKDILKNGGTTYRALSWYLQGAGGTYDLGQSITLKSDMILAGNTIIEFTLNLSTEKTVRYNPDDPDLSSVDIKVVENETIYVGYKGEVKAENLITFTREGYNLVCWMAGDTEYAIGDELVIGKDIVVEEGRPFVFKAIWEKKQTNIIYNSNYPVGELTNITESTTVGWGTNYSVESKNWDCETAEYLYVISAWNTESNGNGTTYNVGETIKITLEMEGDFNLYAVWTRAYRVIYKDGANQENGTENILVGEEYTFVKTTDVSFTKEGHYIAKWAYSGNEYEPSTDLNPSKAIVLTREVPGKIVVFEAVWAADELTITFVYTNADGTEYSRTTYDTSYGATYSHDFDMDRETLTYDGHNYKFVAFVDDRGNQYTINIANKIVVEQITYSMTLTSLYQKEVTLTYVYASGSKVLTFAAGTVIGNEENPFLVFTDQEMSDNGEGNAKHIGWTDDANNYTFISNASESGFNYVKQNSFATTFTLNNSVVLNILKLDKYELLIYDDISYNSTESKVEFSNSDSAITLVEGDTYTYNYNNSDYKGFVIGGSVFSYDPSTEKDLDASDTFTLDSTLANTYSSDKKIYLYPLQYIDVTFVGLNGAESTKTILAGTSTSPDDVASGDEKSYFSHWVIDTTGETIDFENDTPIFWEDIKVIAVYKNFFSVQYLDSDIANRDALNNTKLKDTDKIKLAKVNNTVVVNGGTVQVDYVKANMELIGWYICYTPNGLSGDYDSRLFALEEEFYPYAYAVGKNLYDDNGDIWTNFYVFPVWEAALIDITFSYPENTDNTEFSLNASGTYKVEYNSDIAIQNVSDTVMTITFTAVEVQGNNSRKYTETTITATALQVSANNILTQWQFTDEENNTSEIDNTFKFTEKGNISFTYTTSAVNITVGVKYAGETQTEDTYGYFYKGTNKTKHIVNYTEKGTSGAYNLKLTAVEQTSTVAEFKGWYVYDEASGDYIKIENDAIFTVNDKVLNITGLKDDVVIYANFSAGYVTVNQTNTYLHTDGKTIDTSKITSLRASFENVYEVDGVSYTSGEIAIDSTKALSVNLNDTVTITYDLTSSVYRVHGIRVSYTLLGETTTTNYLVDNGNGNVSFVVNQVVPYTIEMILVESEIKVHFKGYDGATDLFTKTYQYGATIGEIGLPSANGKDNDHTEDGKLYTFAGWNDLDANANVTQDMDIMSSWIRVYDVVVNNGDSDTVHKIIYTSNDTETTSLSGEYSNYISLSATSKTNYRLAKYIFTYEIDENIVVNLSENVFRLNDVLTQAEVEQTVRMRIDPVYEKLYAIKVYNKDGFVRDSIDQVAIHETINYSVIDEVGYDFVNWNVSYNGKTQTITSLENFKLESLSILDDDSVHLIEFEPVYQLKTFTLTFVVNNSSRGSINASNEGYEIHYGEKITFSGKVATFTDSLDRPQEITATTIGAYQFLGYSTTNSESIEALTEHTITDNIVIYAIFVNATVGITAELHTYVAGTERNDMDGGWIVQIVGGEETTPAASWNLTASTGTTIQFKISTEIGFNLTSVEAKVGNGDYETLIPDGAIYSILITDVTDIQIRFDAIEYDVTIGMGSVTGFTQTPWAYYMDSEDNPVSITTTEANVYQDIAYSLEKTLVIYAEEEYYDIDKIVYTLGTSTTENDIVDYTINADGQYEIKFVVTNDVHIKVYVKFREIQAIFHDYQRNLTGKAKTFTYNQTISGEDVSDATYRLANYYYNASGNQVSVASSAVGGYKQTGWYYIDSNDNHIPFNTASDTYTLDGDLHLYPQHENIYFVKTTIANTYVSGGYTNNEEVISNLFSLYVPSTLIKGYVFVGYECKIGESYVSFMYNGTSWSVKFAAFDSAQTTTVLDPVSGGKYDFDLFKQGGWTSYTQFTIEGKFEYESYTIDFDIATGSTLGEGKLFVDGEENTSYDLTVEYGYTVQYDKTSVATYGVVCFVVTVYDRDSELVKTLYYVPNDACVVNNMEYQLTGGSKTTFNEDTPLSITANTTFTGTFGNATASVVFKFVADANLYTNNNLPIITTTFVNSGISGESISTILKYNHTIANPEYTEARPTYMDSLYNNNIATTAYRVDIPRTQSFTYTLSAGANYELYDTIASQTLKVNGNMEIVVKLKLKTKTISFQNNFYNGTENTPSTQKGYVVLHYKEAVKNGDGFITSFTDKTMGVAGTNSYEVMIYHTDAPYFEVVETTGYQLQGIYEEEYDKDGDNTEVAPYNAASAHYILDTAYDTFNATFVEKEVTFTFAISNGTKNLVVFTKTYKVTDVDTFKNDVQNLTTTIVNGDTYTLNELLVLNANKADFKNVWVDTESATGIWDTTNAYLNAGMLNLDSNVVIYANVVAAHLVEVKAGDNGSISYDADDENHGKTWLLYTNTARGEKYSNLVFKVRGEYGIPTITATPDAGYNTDFKFSAVDNKYKEVTSTLIGSEALTITFEEITLDINVEIVETEDNSYITLNGSALSLNSFNMGSTTTFDELYDQIISLLTSKYGKATDYKISGNNHYIFYSNTGISYYLSLEVSKLYDSSFTVLNFDDAIYTKSGNNDEFTVYIRFGRVDKYEFAIYDLETELVKLYLNEGDVVDLANLEYPGTEYTLSEYASEHNFGLTDAYYLHLSPNGNAYSRFSEDLDNVHGYAYLQHIKINPLGGGVYERVVNTSIQNTTFTMDDQSITLYVVAAKELSLQITLCGDTTSADEELTKHSIDPNGTQISPAPKYFEGKYISESEIIAAVQAYFESAKITIFDILGIGDKDGIEENWEIIVTESTTSDIINVVVRICKITTSTRLINGYDATINIPVDIQYDQNYVNPGYFSAASNDPFYESGMPYIMDNGIWVQNPALTSEEFAPWAPTGCVFVGYLVVDEEYILGMTDGRYTEANGTIYDISEYNLASFHNGIINPDDVYSFVAMYYSSYTLNFSRNVTNYVDGVKSSNEYLYSDYGYAYEITYMKWTASGGNYTQEEKTTTVYSTESLNQISASLDDITFKVIYADYYTISIPSYTGGTSEEKSIDDIDINGGEFKCITFTLSPNSTTGNVTIGMRAEYITSYTPYDSYQENYSSQVWWYDINGEDVSGGNVYGATDENLFARPNDIYYYFETQGDIGACVIVYYEYYNDPKFFSEGSHEFAPGKSSCAMMLVLEPIKDILFINIEAADGTSIPATTNTAVGGKYSNDSTYSNRRFNFDIVTTTRIDATFKVNSDEIFSTRSTGAYLLSHAMYPTTKLGIMYQQQVYSITSNIIDELVINIHNDIIENDTYKDDFEQYILNRVDYTLKTSNTSPTNMTSIGIVWESFVSYYAAKTTVFNTLSESSNTPVIQFKFLTGYARYSFRITESTADFNFEEGDITSSNTDTVNGEPLINIALDESDSFYIVSGTFYHLGSIQIVATTSGTITISYFNPGTTTASRVINLTLNAAITISTDQEYTISLDTKYQNEGDEYNTLANELTVSISSVVVPIWARALNSAGTAFDTNNSPSVLGTIYIRKDLYNDTSYDVYASNTGATGDMRAINFQDDSTYASALSTLNTSTKHGYNLVESVDYLNMTTLLDFFNAKDKIIAKLSTSVTFEEKNGETLWMFNGTSMPTATTSTWYTLRGLMLSDMTVIDTYTFNSGYTARIRTTNTLNGTQIGKISPIYVALEPATVYAYDNNITNTSTSYYTVQENSMSGSYYMPYVKYDSTSKTYKTATRSTTTFSQFVHRYPSGMYTSSVLNFITNKIAITDTSVSTYWGDNTSNKLTLKGPFATYNLGTSSNIKGLYIYSSGAKKISLVWNRISSTVVFIGEASQNLATKTTSSPTYYSNWLNIKSYMDAGSLIYETMDSSKTVTTPDYDTVTDNNIDSNSIYQLRFAFEGQDVRYWTNTTNIYSDTTTTGIYLTAMGADITFTTVSDDISFVYAVYTPTNNTYNNMAMWSFQSGAHTVLAGYNLTDGNTSLKAYFDNLDDVEYKMYVPTWHFMKNSSTALTIDEDDTPGVATYAYRITTISIKDHGYDEGYFDDCKYNPGDIEYVYFDGSASIGNPGAYSSSSQDYYLSHGGVSGYQYNMEMLCEDYAMISKLTWTHKGPQSLIGYGEYDPGTNLHFIGVVGGSSNAGPIIVNSTTKRIIHAAPNGTIGLSSYSLGYTLIDAMAFAYNQSSISQLEFSSVTGIGTGAFYTENTNFLSENIIFGKTLARMGTNIFHDNRVKDGNSLKITFYGTIPYSSYNNTFGYAKGIPMLFNANSTSKFELRYYARNDKSNVGGSYGFRGSYDKYLFNNDNTSDYYDNYRFIEAPASYFSISSNAINGITATGASNLISTTSGHYQYLVLPSKDSSGNTITWANYLGLVETGQENDYMDIIKIYYQGTHNIGSLFRLGTTNRSEDMGHQVQYLETAINTYTTANCTMGDGTYAAIYVDDSTEDYLLGIDLPHIKTVANTTSSYSGKYQDKLTSIDLPNATSIGEYVFKDLGALATVNIPKVTTIGSYAFEDCSKLTTVVTENLTTIGNYAFSDCSALASLGNVTSTSSTKAASSLGTYFAKNTKISHVNITTTATLAGTAASSGVPNSSGAFNGMTSLKTFNTIGTKNGTCYLDTLNSGRALIYKTKGLTENGPGYYYLIEYGEGNTGSDTITIPGGVVYNNAFVDSKLTTLTLGATDGENLFMGNLPFEGSNITSIILNASLRNVGVTNLSSLYSQVSSSAFYSGITRSEKGGYYIFDNAPKLTSVAYSSTYTPSNSGTYGRFCGLYDGCIYDYINYISGSLENGYYTFGFAPNAKSGTINVYSNTKNIGEYALRDNEVCTSFVINNPTTSYVHPEALNTGMCENRGESASSSTDSSGAGLTSITTPNNTKDDDYLYYAYNDVLYYHQIEGTYYYTYSFSGACSKCNSSTANYLYNGEYTLLSSAKYTTGTLVSDTIFARGLYKCSACNTPSTEYHAIKAYTNGSGSPKTTHKYTVVTCPRQKTGTVDMRLMEDEDSIVVGMEDYAFYASNLSVVHISQNVQTKIKYSTFNDADGMALYNHSLYDIIEYVHTWNPVWELAGYFDESVFGNYYRNDLFNVTEYLCRTDLKLYLLPVLYARYNPYINSSVNLFGTNALSKERVFGFYDYNPNEFAVESLSQTSNVSIINQTYSFTARNYGFVNNYGAGTSYKYYYCEGCDYYHLIGHSTTSYNMGIYDAVYKILNNVYNATLYYCKNCTFTGNIRIGAVSGIDYSTGSPTYGYTTVKARRILSTSYNLYAGTLP